MKKVIILSVFLTAALFVKGQTIGDTLIVDNSSSIAVFKQPKNVGYSGEILRKGDVLVYLSDSNEYSKILLVKSKNYQNQIFYIKSFDHMSKISNKINLSSFSEMNLSPLKTPGNELKKYSNHFYVGAGFMLGGSAVLVVNSMIYDNTALYIVGGGLELIGLIFRLESVYHCWRAGVLLNENGIGLKYQLSK